MTIEELLQELNYHPCENFYIWAKDRSAENIVLYCQRGDWLMHLAAMVGVDKRKLTLASGLCRNTVRAFLQDNSIKQIDLAISYGKREVPWRKVKLYLHGWYGASDNNDITQYAIKCYSAAGHAALVVENRSEGNKDVARKLNLLQTANICREVFGDELEMLLNKRLGISNPQHTSWLSLIFNKLYNKSN